MKLKILASDIKNSNYTSPDDCAIARALKRNGMFGFLVGPTGINYEGEAKQVYLIRPDHFYTLNAMYAYVNPVGWEVLIKEIGTLKPKDFILELV